MAEKNANARPELKDYLDSVDEYDTIYLGYPNWWGTCPMPVFTFLDRYDMTGKTIIPFCTNEGSGLGSSVQDIKAACPTANVKNGIAITGSQARNSQAKVKKFVGEN